jgi:phage terminase Nu1 subunit (DNA packaging protein)
VIEGPVVGVETLSSYLGISKQVIYEHARAGRLKKVGHNEFDLQESVRLYCEHLRALASRYKSANGTDITNTMTARARKERAQAQFWELKAQRMRGELVAVDEVRDAWLGIVNRVQGRFLALHSTLIVRAGLSKTQATTLREAIREALTELADNETGAQSADGGPH